MLLSCPITFPAADETVITSPCTVAVDAWLSQVSTPSQNIMVDATAENVIDWLEPGAGAHVPVSRLQPSLPLKVRSAEMERNGDVEVRVSVQYPIGQPCGPTVGSVALMRVVLVVLFELSMVR